MLKPKRILWSFAVSTAFLIWPAAGAEATFKTHVEHAKAAMIKHDAKTAGSDLLAASEYLGKAAANAPGAATEGLAASAREMRTLSDDVAKGSVTDVGRIDRASARGYHALAKASFVRATERWTKKDTKATGHALKSAADHLEDGTLAAGRDAGGGSRDVARGTREVAGKLVQGSGWTSEEVGRSMEQFGKELAKFGKRVGSKV